MATQQPPPPPLAPLDSTSEEPAHVAAPTVERVAALDRRGFWLVLVGLVLVGLSPARMLGFASLGAGALWLDRSNRQVLAPALVRGREVSASLVSLAGWAAVAIAVWMLLDGLRPPSLIIVERAFGGPDQDGIKVLAWVGAAAITLVLGRSWERATLPARADPDPRLRPLGDDALLVLLAAVAGIFSALTGWDDAPVAVVILTTGAGIAVSLGAIAVGLQLIGVTFDLARGQRIVDADRTARTMPRLVALIATTLLIMGAGSWIGGYLPGSAPITLQPVEVITQPVVMCTVTGHRSGRSTREAFTLSSGMLEGDRPAVAIHRQGPIAVAARFERLGGLGDPQVPTYGLSVGATGGRGGSRGGGSNDVSSSVSDIGGTLEIDCTW